MKGMIFTTDAIFALVIVGAAISIVVYFNYSTQSPYTLAAGQAQAILNFLSTTQVGSFTNTSSAAFAQCSPVLSSSVLQASVQYYLNGSGSCGTYLLDSAYKNNNYGVFINGVYGPAVNIAQFSSPSNTAVTLGSQGYLDTYPITIEMWIKTKMSSQAGIVNKYYSSSDNGYQVFINSAGQIAGWYYTSGSTYTGQVNGGAIDDGNWHQVIYTVNSSGGYIYVDGGLKGSQAWTGTQGITTSSQSLQFGVYPGGAGGGIAQFFNGSISNVQIYNTSVDAAQVATLYQEGIGGQPLSNAGNIGWWLLEGDSRDYSGLNNTGTAYNGITYGSGNYVPKGLSIAYSVSRAGTLLPFNKYASAYSSNSFYTSSPSLYDVGVYTWR